jgi:hypothetical protein
VDAELERNARDLEPEAARLLDSLLGERDLDARVAVDAVLEIQRRVRVPRDDEQPRHGATVSDRAPRAQVSTGAGV